MNKMRRYIVIISASILFFITITIPMRQILAPQRYRELVKYYAGKYSIDWLLVSALVFHESRFKYNAKSNKGARGLMQIMPQTGAEIARKIAWQGYSDNSLFRPMVNLEFGCYYLSNLLKEFHNDSSLALAAYNAGKGNVYKFANMIERNQAFPGSSITYPDIRKYVYPETKQYVSRVNTTYMLLKTLDRIWRL